MLLVNRTYISDPFPVIRSMRNSWESWNRMDSEIKDGKFILGDKDRELLQRLVKAGSSDRKFLRMLTVTADVTAPLYWWKQYDTYKVGTVANSSSTMHLIMSRDLTLGDFSTDGTGQLSAKILGNELIPMLNSARKEYIKTKEKRKEADQVQERTALTQKMKELKRTIIQLLPESYDQLRTIMINYETLLKIYQERSHHELTEWRQFLEQMDSLPLLDVVLDAVGLEKVSDGGGFTAYL